MLLPFRFTVPVPAVNVEELLQLPPTFKVLVVPPFNVPAVNVTFPETVCERLVPRLSVPPDPLIRRDPTEIPLDVSVVVLAVAV